MPPAATARWLAGTVPAGADAGARASAGSGTDVSVRHRPESPPGPLALDLARGLALLGVTVVTGLLIWSLLPCLLGWRAQVVLTGSMRPGIAPGDLVLAAPAAPGQIQVGRVLLFDDPVHPGHTLVHRLIRVDGNGSLITRGDANAVEDSTPIPMSAVRGLPRLRVPYVGSPVVWMRQHERLPLVGLVVAAFAAFVLLLPLAEERFA